MSDTSIASYRFGYALALRAKVSTEQPIDSSSVRGAPHRVNWKALFFQARSEPQFGRIEAVVLALYALVLAVTVPFHEPWADEAQAWLIARDSSLWDLFYRRLHYEGTPGLWHLMLWLMARLHLPYASVNWLAALCSVAGAYVWLRYCPLPPVLRYLTPFTYWLLYQYGVIARGYAFIPFFMFLMCSLFFQRRPRPVLFALAAGLLANLSLYSFLWAGCFLLFYIPELMRWKRKHPEDLHLTGASALACALFLFALYTAMPAPDLVHRTDAAGHFIHRSALRDKLIPPTPGPHFPEAAAVSVQPQMKFATPPEGVDTGLYERGNWFQKRLIEVLYPQTQTYRAQTMAHRLRYVLNPLDVLFYAYSASNLLGLVLLILSALWLFARRALRFMLPLALMLGFGAVTNINDHHAGLFFIALLSALWMGVQQPSTSIVTPRFHKALMLALVVVVVEQIAWSASAVTSDIRFPFDPGKATAEFLKQNAAGKRVMALQYQTISAVPYLSGLPFENQPTTYWMYSENFPYGKRFLSDIATRPDFFITGVYFLGDRTVGNQIVPAVPAGQSMYAIDPRTMTSAGYRELARFCGQMFMHGGTATTYCNIMYVPGTGRTMGSR